MSEAGIPKQVRAACAIAIVSTVVTTLASIGQMTFRQDDFPTAYADGIRGFGIVTSGAFAVVAIIAAARTARGSRGWRMTLIVFSALTVAGGVMGIVSALALRNQDYVVLNSDGSERNVHTPFHPWVVALTVGTVIAAIACLVLLTRRPVVDYFKPRQAPAPAGWYPGPDGRMQWWTGTTWAAAIPPPEVEQP